MSLVKRRALVSDAIREAEALQGTPGTSAGPLMTNGTHPAAQPPPRMLPRMVPASQGAHMSRQDTNAAPATNEAAETRSRAHGSMHETAEASPSGRGVPQRVPPRWRGASSLRNLVGREDSSTDSTTSAGKSASSKALVENVSMAVGGTGGSQRPVGFTSERYSGIRLMTSKGTAAPLSDADLAGVLADSWQPQSFEALPAAAAPADVNQTPSHNPSARNDAGVEGAAEDGDGVGMQALVGEDEEFSVGAGALHNQDALLLLFPSASSVFISLSEGAVLA